MSIDSPEQADEVVLEADRLKGGDHSEDGLRRQADYIMEHLGPKPSPHAKQLVHEAIERRCPQ